MDCTKKDTTIRYDILKLNTVPKRKKPYTMFFFYTQGSDQGSDQGSNSKGAYVALEPDGQGFICMGTFENLGTEEEPVYYFDGRYTDHMIETSMMDPVYAWTKRTATKVFLKRLGIRDKADVYSYENTKWILKRL